jgi:hypothetical protein
MKVLSTTPTATSRNLPFPPNLYMLWDLHIRRDIAPATPLCHNASFAPSLTPTSYPPPALGTVFSCLVAAFSGANSDSFSRPRLCRPSKPTGTPAIGASLLATNESAPDPGLSLETPVEQPSPRTAQEQPKSLRFGGKWLGGARVTAQSGYTIGLLKGSGLVSRKAQ